MESRTELWRLHNLAQTYGQRPSAVLGIADTWAAFQLDMATMMLGRWVESRLSERNRDGSAKWSIEYLLGVEKPEKERAWMDVRSLKRFAAK